MSTTLGIVEVPALDSLESNSDGLVTSIAANRFGNNTLLDWVVRRVTDALLLDQVIIVTDAQQGELIEKLAPPNIEVFTGTQPDSLGRLTAAIRHYDADQLVRVPICCPFVDPELIDRLICTAGVQAEFDYISHFSMDGRPAVLSKVGLFGEWCSAGAVFRANAQARHAADRSSGLQFILKHPELFQLRFIPIPEKLDRTDVRLTLETAGDWDNAHLIFDALGPERLDWRRIVELLDEHPDLRERMASLNKAEATV